jgi:rubrerythrin
MSDDVEVPTGEEVSTGEEVPTGPEVSAEEPKPFAPSTVVHDAKQKEKPDTFDALVDDVKEGKHSLGPGVAVCHTCRATVQPTDGGACPQCDTTIEGTR